MRKNQTSSPFALQHNVNLAEVVDKKGQSLFYMPYASILEQKLCHWRFIVVIKDKLDRIYLHKKPIPTTKGSEQAFLWTLPASYRKAGESLEDSALKKLQASTGLILNNLDLTDTIDPCEKTKWAFLGVFETPKLSQVDYETLSFREGMFLDEDEFNALINEMPEVIDPMILHCYNTIAVME